jgi:hypothetical protein
MEALLTEFAVEAHLNEDSGKSNESPEWEAGPFSGRGKVARQERAIAQVEALARSVIAEQDEFAFGHGFLWGHVAGKRVLIASIDGRAGHNEIERRVREHPAVEYTWINLD